MRPYIVINGKSSKAIHGLLIQSLPPISKPAMRTEIEEIDGRDGDVVTTLGYSAYDRAVLIGLKGDYNIDDVIEYFNSGGEIVFSNEPDKVYKFAMYEQIDFERLVRFRTAEVIFHVQPFKNSAIELPIVRSNLTGTILNIPIRNIGNIYSKPMIKFKASGEVNIYINEVHKLEVDLDETTEVTIDVVGMNATDAQGNYINRQVTGDYDKLTIPVGINEFRITGAVQEVEIANYSRWI